VRLLSKKYTVIARTRSAMMTLMSLSNLYAFMYCMLVSRSLVAMPIFGGALFMSSRVAAVFFQSYTGEARKYLSFTARWLGPAMLTILLLSNFFLLMIYPITLENPAVWILFTIVLGITMRGILCRRIMRRFVNGHLSRRRFWILSIVCHAVPAAVVAILLTWSVDDLPAWQMFGGFLISAALEAYSLWKDRSQLKEPEAEIPQEDSFRSLAQGLHKLNAFNAYELMHNLILVALQVTLVMLYTFIATSAQEILTCMLLSLVCTLAARELTDWVLARTRRRDPDPAYLLLIGLCCWMYGLILFSQQISGSLKFVSAYLSLALCSCGATVSATCLAGMERDMHRVAQFGAGEDLSSYPYMRSAGRESAVLAGQMLTLLLLTLLCFINGFNLPRDVESLLRSFRPVLVVPALLLVLGAMLSVLKFPLTKRYLNKLQRFLQLQGDGEENAPMKNQLETVVIRRHPRRYGLKLLMFFLRPFYYHKLVGRENVPTGMDGQLIFICNHGELYGPVVTNLYVPFSFRPWTISDMMDSRDNVADYCYKYTFKRQKWLPEKMKKPISRWLAPLCIWAMRSIESIPVYRNKPRELMTTFRMSVEAMQAEDNLLIFPENPDAASLDKPGYLRKGIGDFFTGFTMLAPLYYNKTGKRAIFMPVYASREKRTISFGKGIEYDPEKQPVEEKMRIVNELRESMLFMGRAQGDF
jgi:hypothetical protein